MMKKLILLALIALLTGCGKDIIIENDLKKGLENYIKSEYNDNQYEATLNDGKMKVSVEEEEYTLKYNLKKEPVFIYETKIEKGISYEEYVSKTDAVSLPMLGFVASAYTYGVNAQDAYTYFVSTFLEGMMENYKEIKYIIVYDEEEVESDYETILVSEFGDKVIDYMKASYDEDVKIANDIYTYDLTSKCKNDVCTLKAKLTINSEADFSKINGYADEMAKENMYDDITPESADYHIQLKVGQKIKITGKNLNGYELTGMDVVDATDDYSFIAVRAGIANGYLFIGDDKQRSIYVTVTDSEENEVLQDKSLKIK